MLQFTKKFSCITNQKEQKVLLSSLLTSSIVVIFFQELFLKLHDGLRGCDRPRLSKCPQKAVNFEPCDLLKSVYIKSSA